MRYGLIYATIKQKLNFLRCKKNVDILFITIFNKYLISSIIHVVGGYLCRLLRLLLIKGIIMT